MSVVFDCFVHFWIFVCCAFGGELWFCSLMFDFGGCLGFLSLTIMFY